MNQLLTTIIFALSILSSSVFSNEIITSNNSRNITDCSKGGVYLNNSVELAMCWGDNVVIADYQLHRQGFVRVFDYPSSPDAYFYKGGLVFGSDVEFIRLLFRNNELVEIYTVFKNVVEPPSYYSLSQTYEEFRDYFTNEDNGYSMTYDTKSDKVFQGAYSSCNGDCGRINHDGDIIDIEISLFMTNRAKQRALFIDNQSIVGIKIEVPKWDLIGTNRVDRFTLKFPSFTMCFSEPIGSIHRLNEKLKRRKN